MNRFSLIAILALTTACGMTRSLQNSESSQVEVRTETVIQHDTAFVELPVVIEKVATLDTTSVLENKYAKSAVSVSAGVLNHSLETKPVSLPVKVENKIVYKDSLVFKDRIITETVEVERQLTQWQKFRMKLGELFFWFALGALTYFIIHLLLNLNLKKL